MNNIERNALLAELRDIRKAIHEAEDRIDRLAERLGKSGASAENILDAAVQRPSAARQIRGSGPRLFRGFADDSSAP